jgi:cyclopropane fatty-acyl-phospholipid synthase-like methyltransferase
MGTYYHTKKSVEEYIEMARGHDGRKIIAKLKEHLPAGSHLLEIGSGPGTDWKLLKEHYKVIGSDQSREFLKHLQANNPEGKFLELDAASLNTPLLFDGIYSNKVLHHLEDEALIASVKRQYELLHPGGIVCHTFWHGQDSEIYNDLFVNYHTDEGIGMLFGEYFDHKLFHYYKEFDKGDSFLYIGKRKKGLST